MSYGQNRSHQGHRTGGRSQDPAYANRPPRRREGLDDELIESLHRLDGRNYGSYKSLIGDWDYGPFTLAIDRVQADPFAPPSSCRVTATPEAMGIPADLIVGGDGRVGVADFLNRAFETNIGRFTKPGTVTIARPGQEILVRSACTVSADQIELRFQVQMPARGRTIMGHTAAEIFDHDVPDIVMETLDFAPEGAAEYLERLRAHVATYEDYQALQGVLAERGWIGFVANGAVLPRRSGVSELPMGEAVAFESPESLREAVELPHAGEVAGMALKPGITVIVGGGYHGKSTLLSALQRGVYAHIRGDGRELVATVRTAMKVRAADGRSVTGVDVSPFIAHLPQGADTTVFSTENASGSTSQAASIMEAAELGAKLLLLDEDTSATNLLIRDSRMRELVHAEKEPITPLVDRIGALAADRGISTIMVMGGSGDYLDVADRVLMMDTYRCFDVTDKARAVVASQPRERSDEASFPKTAARRVLRGSKKGDRPKTKVFGRDAIQLDKQRIDVSDIEQIVEGGQAEAIAWAIRGILEHTADGDASIASLTAQIGELLEGQGLGALTAYGARQWPANLTMPRPIDVGAALNRYRGLNLA
ncbi:MAG: ABC-ATPase domain-containing protein [Ancrocorticia sp.]|uniref:ABC-ATPase domain-containing protein n=1 Tax=Ancrocorticia sp. TaxID=2593684 RepID=UPI003F8F8D8B